MNEEYRECRSKSPNDKNDFNLDDRNMYHDVDGELVPGLNQDDDDDDNDDDDNVNNINSKNNNNYSNNNNINCR